MLAHGEDLDELPGIGHDLADKITIIARGEHLPMLAELEHDVSPGITALLALPGLGPKRVHLLHEKLGIDTVAKLKVAAKSGKLRTVAGIGAVIEARVLRAISEGAGAAARTKLTTAEQIVAPLLRHLRQAEGVQQIEVAGSYRRRRETVGDLDIVVAASPSRPVIQRFVGYEDVAAVLEQGSTRCSVRLRNGLQVDLRAVTQQSFGAALCYFTGSKALHLPNSDLPGAYNSLGLFGHVMKMPISPGLPPG